MSIEMVYRILDICSGTGSWARWVASQSNADDYEVVSVDLTGAMGFRPTIVADVKKWDYASTYARKHFDFVHASPPCTMYSTARTTAKTPRDLVGADQVVKACLDIIAYFDPPAWTVENPQSGLLKTRAIMAGLPYCDVDYCCYGEPFRKRTRIWTNLSCFRGLKCNPQTCPRVEMGPAQRYKHTVRIAGMDKWMVGRIPSSLITDLVSAARSDA